MIQRYDVDYCTQHACTCEVVKDNEGGYVEYEDYAALEEKYSEAQRELVALRSQVRDASALVKQLHDVVSTIGVDVDACEKQDEAWTVWRGGENPVPGKMVEFELLNGYKSKEAVPSDSLTWDKVTSPTGAKIVAYRVVKEG
ncbi:TPA: hypothetical protein JLA97_003940 [Escherichia coli]|nr:hypothetical protein [Escherichia coli]